MRWPLGCTGWEAGSDSKHEEVAEMADEKKPKQYIKYTAAELNAVPSQHQMEQEMERVRSQFGLGSIPVVDIASEYAMYRLLGPEAYVAKKRAEMVTNPRRLF